MRWQPFLLLPLLFIVHSNGSLIRRADRDSKWPWSATNPAPSMADRVATGKTEAMEQEEMAAAKLRQLLNAARERIGQLTRELDRSREAEDGANNRALKVAKEVRRMRDGWMSCNSTVMESGHVEKKEEEQAVAAHAAAVSATQKDSECEARLAREEAARLTVEDQLSKATSDIRVDKSSISLASSEASKAEQEKVTCEGHEKHLLAAASSLQVQLTACRAEVEDAKMEADRDLKAVRKEDAQKAGDALNACRTELTDALGHSLDEASSPSTTVKLANANAQEAAKVDIGLEECEVERDSVKSQLRKAQGQLKQNAEAAFADEVAKQKSAARN